MAALQNAQQALVSALRREDAAAKQVERLQSELAALQDLLAANQRELQRNQMVMKFRNAEVDRRRVCHLVHQHKCKPSFCCGRLCCKDGLARNFLPTLAQAYTLKPLDMHPYSYAAIGHQHHVCHILVRSGISVS